MSSVHFLTLPVIICWTYIVPWKRLDANNSGVEVIVPDLHGCQKTWLSLRSTDIGNNGPKLFDGEQIPTLILLADNILHLGSSWTSFPCTAVAPRRRLTWPGTLSTTYLHRELQSIWGYYHHFEAAYCCSSTWTTDCQLRSGMVRQILPWDNFHCLACLGRFSQSWRRLLLLRRDRNDESAHFLWNRVCPWRELDTIKEDNKTTKHWPMISKPQNPYLEFGMLEIEKSQMSNF